MESNFLKSIEGQRVVVTGGGSGIGACIVELLKSYGASVGVHYRDSKPTEEIVYKCNLLSTYTHSHLINHFIDKLGGIDVLVNNAGAIYGYDSLSDLNELRVEDTFKLNAIVPLFLSQEVFPIMRKQGKGKIINISSVSVKYGGSEKTIHYAMAKSALETMTVGLARTGAPDVLVNSIRAGFIDTQLHKGLGGKNIEERINLIPLKRAGQPIDIARMVAFLVSEAGDWITGQVFTVSGGD